MVEIRIRQVESSLEQRIITGMIVSDEFISEIQEFFNPEYFQNQYCKTISTWCQEYYSEYQKAPFKDISLIYTAKSLKLESEESTLISELLQSISDKFSVQSLNGMYLLDQTIEYFKKRELEMTAGNIQVLLMQGDVKSAEQEILNFHKISKTTTQWENPLLPESSGMAFSEINSISNFKKDLGRFIGKVSRTWLIGIMGPFKRGKTWFADEWAFAGMLGFKRVVKFSLEMNEAQNKQRLYRRLTAFPDHGNSVVIPVFDCSHNQCGRCKKKERLGTAALVKNESDDIPRFNPSHPLAKVYKPCSVCKEKEKHDYEFAVWYQEVKKDDVFDEYSVKNRLKAYKLYSNYYRLRCYPRFTANCEDLMRDLDILERREGYIPDLIVVDMVDILAPERKGLTGVEKEDESWMALARLASERNCVVVTPTQVTREAQDATNLKTTHSAKWIGKLGHVDAMYTINQTPHEKKSGYARIGCIEHRHSNFDEDTKCYVMQNLDIGQFCLDSWIK